MILDQPQYDGARRRHSPHPAVHHIGIHRFRFPGLKGCEKRGSRPIAFSGGHR
jgi:hypothetical protein